MKKSIRNLGKPLNKKQQKQINGGGSCQLCYSANGGMYNALDPNCQECLLPVPHE